MDRRLLALPGLLAGVLVLQAALVPPAQAAGQRYAAPTGSGTTCTSAAPCSLVTAVNGAGSSTEVIVAPGTYDVGGTSLARPGTVTGLNLHGVPGQPRPVVNTTANIGVQLLGTGSRVADLTINQTGSQWGLNVFAANVTVERVEVRSSAQIACGLGYSGLARDLLCVTSATGGIAFDDTWGGGTGVLTMRNVTAVATGAGSYGIRADSTGDSTNLDINAKNVIASGSTADIRSAETGTSSESDVILTNSNYDTISEVAGGNVTNVGSNPTNQTAAPVFADASYHQAPGSPTIDRGISDASIGSGDLDGEPRTYGAAPDIGVDELVPDTTAPDVAFDHTPKRKTHKRKAIFTFHATEASTFTCKVDKHAPVPCASPFKVKVKKRGKHTVQVIARDAAGNVDASPATCTWKVKHKLRRHHGQHGHH